MESVSHNLQFLTDLTKGIAARFGDNYEVILHDLTRPYEVRSLRSRTGT
ncbi:hypothetical protein [Paenibacillus mendelii]|uniref:Uncharacterized protein n=1 Tax=Paenibacillus mendelii TaxID=206163 RepID=A0ABV6J376_9BACL|nr:hypothetical protein [Paenibacillus mendelii]